MGNQRLSDKSARRLGRLTGLAVARAWSITNNDRHLLVVNPDHPDGHEHWWCDRRAGEHELIVNPMHYNTCRERWWEIEET